MRIIWQKARKGMAHLYKDIIQAEIYDPKFGENQALQIYRRIAKPDQAESTAAEFYYPECASSVVMPSSTRAAGPS